MCQSQTRCLIPSLRSGGPQLARAFCNPKCRRSYWRALLTWLEKIVPAFSLRGHEGMLFLYLIVGPVSEKETIATNARGTKTALVDPFGRK
jgi:hypothetical protein